jgi:hypothetical protein
MPKNFLMINLVIPFLIVSKISCMEHEQISGKSEKQQSNFLDMVITNPLDALNNCKKGYEKFIKCNEMWEIQYYASYVFIWESIKIFEEKYPLFLLDECTREGWQACLLSRERNPKFREAFENSVVSELLKRENPVYTEFGSGGAFQTAVILAKMLKQKPGAAATVHLIEPDHEVYVRAHEILKDGLKVSLDYNFAIDPIFEELGKQIYGEPDPNLQQLNELILSYSDKEELSDEEEHKQDLYNVYMREEMKYKQMLGWLASNFPQAKLSLYLHSSTDDYLKYVEENVLPYPDVVAAADIQDETSLERKSLMHYAQLCMTVLQKNPGSSNIWLMQADEDCIEADENISIGLATYVTSEPQTPDPWTEIRWHNEKDEENKLYVQAKVI